MNQVILVVCGVGLTFFIWVWIGIVIMSRMSLEKRIEKLASITNPLPEEERALKHLKELRAIEHSKIASTKWVLFLFMLFLFGSVLAMMFVPAVQEFFGTGPLAGYARIAFILLGFFCLPIFVGLTLAGSGKDIDKDDVDTQKKTEEVKA